METTAMICESCCHEFQVIVPDGLKDHIDQLQFYCGDCGREKGLQS